MERAFGRYRFNLFGWLALILIVSLLGELPYVFIRGLGDDLWSGNSVETIEQFFFAGSTPTRYLQESLYERNLPWLDYAGFLLHGTWFGITFAFAMVLIIYQRQRLLEYVAWQLVGLYIGALFFLFLPVRPPWMEEGIVRVLTVRDFGHYTGLDNNPMAAFPSMHASVPAMTAMFLFLRCDRRLRIFAWLVSVYTVLLSFAIVYMGEHWVLDVVAGYALAATVAWFCTNARVLKLSRRLPKDPVGWLISTNTAICEGSAEDERAGDVALPLAEAA